MAMQASATKVAVAGQALTFSCIQRTAETVSPLTVRWTDSTSHSEPLRYTGRAVCPPTALDVASGVGSPGWRAAGEGAQPPLLVTTFPVSVVRATRLSSDQTTMLQSLLAGPGLRLVRKNRLRPPDITAGCTAPTRFAGPGTVMSTKSSQSDGVEL